MTDYPKHIKRIIRQWMNVGYERELTHELAGLDQSFAGWRAGDINAGELVERIHKFEVGPAHELWKKYYCSEDDLILANLIVEGILSEDEVPEEIIEALATPLSFYRSLKERGNLRVSGD